MISPRNLLLGLLYGLVAGALWGGVFLAPKLLDAFTPLQMTAGRYIAYGLAAAVLLAPSWRSVMARMDRRDWRDLAGLSLLGNLVYYVGLSVAVQTAGVALASLIIGLLPVTITLAGARKGEGAPLRALAAPLALIIAGGVCINVAVFTTPSDVPVGKLILGVLGATLALAVWTAYAVWNARRLAATPKFSSHEWSLLTGLVTGLLSLVLVVPAFLMGGPMGGEVHAPAAWGWFWMVSFAVAIGASVIGNGLWNGASRLLPLSLSGQLIVFETLFALLYGFLHEGRWPHVLEWSAIVLMLAGVLWSVRLHRPGAAHAAE
ncbi:EamA family transporter [Caulobacter sp. D4A]|uniref:DMT family transporter n=1 Tax=unclassified Caulobacter TaxID=2648921 RepID=UPI000D727E67|nr:MULTISPECIES: DMT family transporter [unclassified Caulobacter]PXA85607.1 EamA family transporter [Caulobacter sp. D4A]PXA96312.1 EamA family transporter [Caulobacter sp. D5]